MRSGCCKTGQTWTIKVKGKQGAREETEFGTKCSRDVSFNGSLQPRGPGRNDTTAPTLAKEGFSKEWD